MKIKVLLVMPGKEVQTVRIPANLKFIKSFIGSDLYKIQLNENTILIANNNAQVDEFNRIYKGQIILGSFLIIGVKNNHYTSLKKKQIRKFTNMFKIEKHQRKIERYKDEYLEEFYFNQRIKKQENATKNRETLFKAA